jgi:hypothetical protein
MCCPCCSVNQLYQTTRHRGNPFRSHGRSSNVNTFLVKYPSCDLCSCDIFRSFLCMPCTIGDILHDSIAMPWYMACCTVHPCAMRNLYRYHYRVKGNDDCTELYCSIFQCPTFPSQSLQSFFWIFNSCMILQILQDSRIRRDLQQVIVPSAPPQPIYIDSHYIEIN